jgi:hypothetical protein
MLFNRRVIGGRGVIVVGVNVVVITVGVIVVVVGAIVGGDVFLMALYMISLGRRIQKNKNKQHISSPHLKLSHSFLKFSACENCCCTAMADTTGHSCGVLLLLLLLWLWLLLLLMLLLLFLSPGVRGMSMWVSEWVRNVCV